MKGYRLKVGIDVDDVIYECNGYALKLINEKNPELAPLSVNDIKFWGTNGTRLDERIPYFSDVDFVRAQPIFKGAKEFIHKLSKIAEPFFVTAVPPECMTARAERLISDFPDVPRENIIIGTRKDVVHLDIALDDGAHNVISSTDTYPVLFRRPWNMQMTGLLSVNNYEDFLHIVEQVSNSYAEEDCSLSDGGVVCLIGPSGSGKTAITEELIKDQRFEKPVTTTTRKRRDNEPTDAYHFTNEADFIKDNDAGKFLESTVYSGHHYGTSRAAIDEIMNNGKIAVLPIDICGGITIKNNYRNKAKLIFVDRDKETIISEIVKRNITDNDKTRRIVSLDYEFRNREMCDEVVKNNGALSDAVNRVYQIVQ